MAATSMKMSKGISSASDFLKENQKPLIYLGVGVAVVVLGVVVVKGVGLRLDKILTDPFDTSSNKTFDNLDVNDKIIIDNSKVTITNQQAKIYAENLLQAFNEWTGTDEDMVKLIFGRLSTEDFKKVYAAFGKKTYSYTNNGSPSGVFWGSLDALGKEDLDLIQWLNEELGRFDGQTKAIVRKVVEPAGFLIQ